MIEVYRGSANAWECDEMGHVNVRFYVSRMMEGLGILAHEIGLSRAFQANATSTLLPRDQHIRFLKEAIAGQPIHMLACVLDQRPASALIYQEIRHKDGTPCAAFRTWVDHIDVETSTPFSWSERTRAKLAALSGPGDEGLAPRSLPLEVQPLPDPKLGMASELGAPVNGRGMVMPHHCDALGRMQTEFFIARISDSVGNLLAGWRRDVADDLRPHGVNRIGSAVLENRLIYRKWPRAGQCFEIRSSIGEARGKAHSLVHWILDPATGDAWCTSEVVAVMFDLDKRKAVAPSPRLTDELARLAPAGLRI